MPSTCTAMASHSSSLPVVNKPPPPPPRGWSEVCKTVAFPTDKKEEGDSDALPVRIIDEVRSKKDADAVKKKNPTRRSARRPKGQPKRIPMTMVVWRLTPRAMPPVQPLDPRQQLQ